MSILFKLQALWRWLMTHDNNVQVDERQENFQVFREILYSENENDFNTAKEKLENLPSVKKNDKLKK